MNKIKRFNDYNEKELLELTEKEIEDLISLECAFEGIQLEMKEPIFMERETIIPKVTAYRICEITFLDLPTAEQFLHVLNRDRIYYTTYENNNYSCRYLEEITPEHYRKPKMEVISVVLPEVWREIKEEQKALHQRKEIFKKQYEAWEKWKNQREEILEPIQDAIITLQNRENDKRNCVQQFERYLEMAKGDFEIALLFYEKFPAMIKDEEFLQYLTETYGNKTKANNNE
jgi:hypothetical protein